MCITRVFFLNIFLFFLAQTKNGHASQELKNPSPYFSRHVIVKPIIHHGRPNREILTTKKSNGAHYPEVQVTLEKFGEHWVLDLKLNEDLVTAGHKLLYQERGNTVQLTPDKQDLDLCHYSGNVRGRPMSWVAVSTCHGLSGVIYDGEKMRYIEPAQGPALQSPHYIYDRSDLKRQPQSGYRSGITNNSSNDPELANRQRARRDVEHSRSSRNINSSHSEIHEPYNANNISRYVELVLVADHRTYLASGNDVRRVQSRMIEIANIVNSMYSPLNIFIALVGVVVWSEGDKIKIEKKMSDTLFNFKEYRRKELNTLIPNDNAHLWFQPFSDENLAGSGYIKKICHDTSCGVASLSYNASSGYIASVIAHEIGHNLGISHDEKDCECTQLYSCIMGGGMRGVAQTYWTSCNLRDLANFLSKGLDQCLHNKPKRLFESPTCGNGFIEPGEECDCGITTGGGINPCHACCHPDTCKLRANATCGAGACCDLTKCSFRSASTVCRVAESDCDLPEYCTGLSEYCPGDVYKMDSTPCSTQNNQAYCVRGACRSHTDQCRLLWENKGVGSPPDCYNLNTHGTYYGNCGPLGQNGQYKRCLEEDVLCGRLHCTKATEDFFVHYLNNGKFATSSSIVRNGVTYDCRIAEMYVELNEPDISMVPDGAKCGHEKMCLKQRCVPVSAVRAELASVCPSNCSGHGVCNSVGHCHCEAGFAPPLCATPGLGGSVDSGPATDPRVQVIIMITTFVIFLGIVPMVALLLFLFCYFWEEKANSVGSYWETYFRDKIFRLQNSSLFYSLRDLNQKRMK